MSRLRIELDGTVLEGKLFQDQALESVDAMREFLPLESDFMHVRWSGHAVWVDIDEVALPDIPRENHTVYPSRGAVLFCPDHRNEQEILLSCGPTRFKSPAGELAGNHVATVEAGERRARESGGIDSDGWNAGCNSSNTARTEMVSRST